MQNRFFKSNIIVCIFLAIVFLASMSYARTVVLVYDDSGSMTRAQNEREDRDLFANYSMQNLVAMLDKGDRLAVVKMSTCEATSCQIDQILPSNDKYESINRVANWQDRGSTPYAAVETAAGQLQQFIDQDSINPALANEDYWLVVFSDGGFEIDGTANLAARDARIRNDISGFIARHTTRKVGVVFMGIGATFEQVPWQDAGATVYLADTAQDITGSMFDIAALISGRDPALQANQGLQVQHLNNGRVAIRSDLPLRRILMFYQGNAPVNLEVSNAVLNAGGQQKNLSADGPYSTADAGLFGQVSALSAPDGSILNPGTFEIDLATNLNLSDPRTLSQIRFLPEVDLALNVVQVNQQVCIGDVAQFSASLLKEDGSALDLSGLQNLEVWAEVASTGQRIGFSPQAADSYSLNLPMNQPQEGIVVSARFPGYFNLRSQGFRIQAQTCAAAANIQTDTTEIVVPASFVSDFEQVASVQMQLSVEGEGLARANANNLTQVPVRLTATIPEGINLQIAGQTLNQTNNTLELTLPLQQPFDIQVSSNEAFQQATDQLSLSFESLDEALNLNGAIPNYQLRMKPVEVLLLPEAATTIAVTPSFSQSYDITDLVNISLSSPTSLGNAFPVELTAKLLTGSRLSLDNLSFTPTENTQRIVFNNQPKTLNFERNRDLPLKIENQSVSLSVTDKSDARIQWVNDTVTLNLAMTARNLSLEASNPDWRMPLDGMKNSPAFSVLPKVDGQPVSVEEFKDWKFRVRSPSNLRVLREVDRDNPSASLFARPSFPLGFTPVGQQNIELEATSPFGETVTLPVSLIIGDIPFWKKWGWWLVGILLLLLLLLYIIGLLRKKRFSSGAILEYQRFRKRPKMLARNPRPDEEMSYLFKDHLTFGSRWMPYKNQTAVIDSLSFEAKGSKSIQLHNAPEDYMLNSELIGSKKPIVRPNAEISREVGQGKEAYVYRS